MVKLALVISTLNLADSLFIINLIPHATGFCLLSKRDQPREVKIVAYLFYHRCIKFYPGSESFLEPCNHE